MWIKTSFPARGPGRQQDICWIKYQPASHQPSPGGVVDFKCTAVIYESRGGNTQPPAQTSWARDCDPTSPCPADHTAASCSAREGEICCEKWGEVGRSGEVIIIFKPLSHPSLSFSHVAALARAGTWPGLSSTDLTLFASLSAVSPSVPRCPPRSPPTVRIFSV